MIQKQAESKTEEHRAAEEEKKKVSTDTVCIVLFTHQCYMIQTNNLPLRLYILDIILILFLSLHIFVV